MTNDIFPYYDDSIVFPDNLPPRLQEYLDGLREAWEKRDIYAFVSNADILEPLMKHFHMRRTISDEVLEKFYVMLGRDWWNRDKAILRKRQNRIASQQDAFGMKPGS